MSSKPDYPRDFFKFGFVGLAFKDFNYFSRVHTHTNEKSKKENFNFKPSIKLARNKINMFVVASHQVGAARNRAERSRQNKNK